jgi:glycosyltransferase involved in cell wall biosynthesis
VPHLPGAPLHIAIDASRVTVARRTGTEHYALRLIRALVALESPHRFTLYFRDTPAPGLLPEADRVGGRARCRVIPLRRLWTHIRFAAALWADRPDVTFVPAHTLPIFFPGRAVVTVHDLGYRRFPEAHPRTERLYLDLTTRFSARRARRILADSQATRDDLTDLYRIDPGKIVIAYPGVEGISRADSEAIAAARTRYGIPACYFLFLGTIQPRKNIRRLAEAFARYIELTGDAEAALVLAGKPGWLIDPARDVLAALPEAVQGRIILAGYVADADVSGLYSGALALVFPSLYEGFGFPVLEAMRCETPVLCANTSSLPELAGDAALLVDPLDVAAMAAGMARLAREPALRAELAARGRQQAAAFTWERAARAALQTLERAAQA